MYFRIDAQIFISFAAKLKKKMLFFVYDQWFYLAAHYNYSPC